MPHLRTVDCTCLIADLPLSHRLHDQGRIQQYSDRSRYNLHQTNAYFSRQLRLWLAHSAQYWVHDSVATVSEVVSAAQVGDHLS